MFCKAHQLVKIYGDDCVLHMLLLHQHQASNKSQYTSLILPSALICLCADKREVWKVRLTSIQGVREEDARCPNQPDSVQQQDFLSKHFLPKSLPHSTWQSFWNHFF